MPSDPATRHSDPSPWVVRWAPFIQCGRVLDVACGAGRHSQFFLDRGCEVTALDRDPHVIPGARFIQVDLESGQTWPVPGEQFEGVVVTNYLFRPIFPLIGAALAPGGVLIYETFMAGHEEFRKPSNPAFLLQPDELLESFSELEVVAFEQGLVQSLKPAVTQRICARKPLMG
jgi:SAM-dependent methyltransferase